MDDFETTRDADLYRRTMLAAMLAEARDLPRTAQRLFQAAQASPSNLQQLVGHVLPDTAAGADPTASDARLCLRVVPAP